MKPRTLTALVVVQTAAIIALAWALAYYARDEWNFVEEGESSALGRAAAVSTAAGRLTVKVSPRAQAASGIATKALEPASYAPELRAYGVVVNLQPLIDLRMRYRAARANASAARAALANSSAEAQRLAELYRDDRNISERALQGAEAAWKTDQARVAGAEEEAANLLASMRNQWGPVLTSWATEQESGTFSRVLSRQDVIVQGVMPAARATELARLAAIVAPIGVEGAGRRAEFVSPSPQSDVAVQGQTFLFRTDGRDLRVGTRVSVRFTSNAGSVDGVVIPAEAVVWYAGTPWVYLQRGGDEFQRYPISVDREAEGGWFNRSGDVKAGERLVVSGAQLLLSEELKSRFRGGDQE